MNRIATALSRLALAACATLAVMESASAQTWTAIAPFGGGATDGAFTWVLNGVPYMSGGVGNPGLFTYNPTANTWTKVADLPGNNIRVWPIAFTHNGKGYFGGGFTNNGPGGAYQVTSDFYEFDPATKVFTPKATMGGGARRGAFTFAIDGKAYVGGGVGTDFANKDDFWVYDVATNTWSSLGTLPGGVLSYATSYVIGGKGYVVTGETQAPVVAHWEFNPTTRQWTSKAVFPGTARTGATSFVIDGKAYVGAGHATNRNYKDFFEYDVTADRWRPAQRYLYPLASTAWCASFVLDGTPYMGTGASFTDQGFPETNAQFYVHKAAAAQPVAQISNTFVDFGPVSLGGSETTTVTIRPTNTAGLKVEHIEFDGDEAESDGFTFTTSKQLPVDLKEGESLDIVITFEPVAEGEFAHDLHVTSNDSRNALASIGVMGQGGEGMLPTIDLSLSTVEFGEVPVGQSITRTIAIAPANELGLTIQSVEFETPNAGQQGLTFTTTTNLPIALEEGEELEIVVTFEPTTGGVVDNRLAITTNDGRNGVTYIDISGEGEQTLLPTIQLSATDVDFGKVAVGSSKTETITIEPMNEAGLTVSGISFSNANAAQQGFTFTTSGTLPIELALGQTVEVTIAFTPTNSGTVDNDLVIQTNDQAPGAGQIELVGEGTSTSGIIGATTGMASASVTPNPADGPLAITLSGVRGETSIRFVNERGDVALLETVGVLDGTNRTWQVDASELTSGVYLIEIVANGRVVSRTKQVVRR